MGEKEEEGRGFKRVHDQKGETKLLNILTVAA